MNTFAFDVRSIVFTVIILFLPLVASAATTSFLYTFSSAGTLKETGSMNESPSPYFWLNSGGKLIIEGGVGKTIQGPLAASDTWTLLYSAANSLDTGGGLYPQNLFRLVTKSKWQNAGAEMRFKINTTNLTDTPNRGPYSGLLFMARYMDSDNLYYAGIRHDGKAVIKKKIGGTYYTLATVQVFGTEGMYNRDTKPNLITEDTWMRLKMTTQNAADGSVLIRLFLDRENDGSYVSILSARDSGTGGSPLRSAGYSGIRSDYMDVEFDNFKISTL